MKTNVKLLLSIIPAMLFTSMSHANQFTLKDLEGTYEEDTSIASSEACNEVVGLKLFPLVIKALSTNSIVVGIDTLVLNRETKNINTGETHFTKIEENKLIVDSSFFHITPPSLDYFPVELIPEVSSTKETKTIEVDNDKLTYSVNVKLNIGDVISDKAEKGVVCHYQRVKN